MTSPALAPPAPTVVPLLIAFADLTHYGAESSRLDDRRLAEIMDEFYERVSARIEAGGGTVVKFLGDAALVVFPEERVDHGIAALLELKREIDAFFEDLGWPSRLLVKAHFGTVVAGPFGAARDKRFDLVGRNVNIAATLDTRSFALSVEAFRQLAPETRKRFKKHTPPITYIPVEARRP
jgi:class 3 adenylate cyclase